MKSRCKKKSKLMKSILKTMKDLYKIGVISKKKLKSYKKIKKG